MKRNWKVPPTSRQECPLYKNISSNSLPVACGVTEPPAGNVGIGRPPNFLSVFARPQPDLLPSVFALLRRDRAKIKGEGGQEKEQPQSVFPFAMTVRQTQLLEF
jgi:hypothetical protein